MRSLVQRSEKDVVYCVVWTLDLGREWWLRCNADVGWEGSDLPRAVFWWLINTISSRQSFPFSITIGRIFFLFRMDEGLEAHAFLFRTRASKMLRCMRLGNFVRWDDDDSPFFLLLSLTYTFTCTYFLISSIHMWGWGWG